MSTDTRRPQADVGQIICDHFKLSSLSYPRGEPAETQTSIIGHIQFKKQNVHPSSYEILSAFMYTHGTSQKELDHPLSDLTWEYWILSLSKVYDFQETVAEMKVNLAWKRKNSTHTEPHPSFQKHIKSDRWTARAMSIKNMIRIFAWRSPIAQKDVYMLIGAEGQLIRILFTTFHHETRLAVAMMLLIVYFHICSSMVDSLGDSVDALSKLDPVNMACVRSNEAQTAPSMFQARRSKRQALDSLETHWDTFFDSLESLRNDKSLLGEVCWDARVCGIHLHCEADSEPNIPTNYIVQDKNGFVTRPKRWLPVFLYM